jgi:hypothetical protein
MTQPTLPGLTLPPKAPRPKPARVRIQAALGEGWRVYSAAAPSRDLMLDWRAGEVTFFARREGRGWTLDDFRGDTWATDATEDYIVATLKARVAGIT